MKRRDFLKSAAAIGLAGEIFQTAKPAFAAEALDAAVKAAQGQKLNIIIDPYQAHKDVISVFAKKYPGIGVQASVIHPSDAAPRILTEQQNNVFAWDAWWGTCANMNSIVLPAGGLEPIDPYLVSPEVTDAANWRLPDWRYVSSKSKTIFAHTHFLINYGAYDASQVPGGKLTLDNLTDPSLVGKYSIRVPNRPHGGTMMLAAIAKSKGSQVVRKILTDMKPVFVDNDRQNTMAVMRGDSAVALGTSEETLYDCHRNSGCSNVNPFPAAVLHSRGLSIPKNAKNKAAITVWVNWLLSKEGQEVFVREWSKTNPGGGLSLRKDVQPGPNQQDSVPDFDHIEQYVAVCTDSGWHEMKQIMDLYKQAQL